MTTAANSRRGSTQTAAGLKVKAKWVRKMRHGIKRCEVRGYPPSAHIHWRPPVQVGERFLFLTNGFVQGSALLASMERYENRQQFEDDTNTHKVTEATAGAKMFANFACKAERGELYAWRLRDFRFFPKGMQPESSKTYGGHEIPEFKGQEKGQVWSNVGFPEALLLEGSPAGEVMPMKI